MTRHERLCKNINVNVWAIGGCIIQMRIRVYCRCRAYLLHAMVLYCVNGARHVGVAHRRLCRPNAKQTN